MSQESEVRKLDRSAWPKGPWDAEPDDRQEWRYQGIACLMVRNHSGAWCGYVGVPLTELASLEKAGDWDSLFDVHGGITYGGRCRGAICHVAQPGEEEVYWVGFDCNHYNDTAPGDLVLMRSSLYPSDLYPVSNYKDAAYARSEVERLASQVLLRMRGPES